MTSLPVTTPTKRTELVAESPTTARPLEMDDDDIHDSTMTSEPGVVTPTKDATASKPEPETSTDTAPVQTAVSDEAAPPKPPRPATEAQKNETILKEAFPSVDAIIIKAVLTASGGKVEPAFNALLEMTDPEAAKQEPEEQPPAQPPRPQGQNPMSQLEADELYARQLAEHYDNVGAYEARTSSINRNRRQQPDLDDEDRERNFIDDDLPIIRENLRQGFLDTQTKVNGWISNLRKRIEDNFDEGEEETHNQGPSQRHSGDRSRRSGDYDRYDADPQVLSDDFAGMRFSQDGTAHPLSGGLHRPPPLSKSPRPNDGRRVGFKEGHEEINMYDSSPKVPPKDTPPTSAMKASKWQPLSSVEPEPIADNDPFSLGDSEDEKEKDTKDKPKDAVKDSKDDEAERLKKAAAEAMSDSLVDTPKADETAAKTA